MVTGPLYGAGALCAGAGGNSVIGTCGAGLCVGAGGVAGACAPAAAL